MTDDAAGWPVALCGVTETVVTTLGPNDRWNVAALGVHASEGDDPATATTWGRTRTWRNFTERGYGYVQFTSDPVDFVEAALTVREEDEPVIHSADAWVRVDVTRLDSGSSTGTEWVEWGLEPTESSIERESIQVINRGFNAVVEATVAVSRLNVPAYDSDELLDRLSYLEDVVETCGGEREEQAFTVLADQADADW